MALYLLRHAHTIWNGPPRRFQGRADVSLSEAGKTACLELRSSLNIQPNQVISSPALRCQETARLLFPDHNIALDERFWEIDNGYFSGLTENEVAQLYPNQWTTWQTTPSQIRPGDGELLSEMLERLIHAINDWTKLSHDKDIIAVTHGGPIRVLKLYFDNQNLDMFNQTHCTNLELFKL